MHCICPLITVLQKLGDETAQWEAQGTEFVIDNVRAESSRESTATTRRGFSSLSDSVPILAVNFNPLPLCRLQFHISSSLTLVLTLRHFSSQILRHRHSPWTPLPLLNITVGRVPRSHSFLHPCIRSHLISKTLCLEFRLCDFIYYYLISLCFN
jgi:hypothetical protein